MLANRLTQRILWQAHLGQLPFREPVTVEDDPECLGCVGCAGLQAVGNHPVQTLSLDVSTDVFTVTRVLTSL